MVLMIQKANNIVCENCKFYRALTTCVGLCCESEVPGEQNEIVGRYCTCDYYEKNED